MKTAGVLGVAALVFLAGCEGQNAIPIFGVVGLAPSPGSGPAGPKGAKGDKGDPGTGAEPISGERLKARYIVGDDGSRQRTGDWLDNETEVPCSYGEATDGELRCLPGDIGKLLSYPNFLDAACTKLVLRQYNDLAPPPTYGRLDFVGINEVHYVKVGAKMPAPATAYRSVTPGECTIDPDDLSDEYFYSVEELPPSFFVLGTIGAEE